MPYQVINVPNVLSPINHIKVVVTEHGDFTVQTNEGWRICEIPGHTKTATASEMADLLNKILAIGFNQGRAYVHGALVGRLNSQIPPL